jgi:glycosyltransferase involved in cell wall biosynthesis
MRPSISVIVPTHNRWPMLRDAIESIFNQSYQDYELVVVDDGSEDASVQELSRYGSALRWVSQPRRGVAAARNLGVSESRGACLAFLDSDDLWHSEKLATQVAFMEAHPEVRICQTEEIWIRNGVRVNPKKRHCKPSGDIFRPSLNLCLVSPSAVMMTRELFDHAGGFDEAFTVCEDYDLWLRISVDTPVALLPEPLVVKRGGHKDQLSRSTWGMDRFRIMALRNLLRSGLRGEKRQWALEALAGKVAIFAQGARKRGREKEAAIYEEILSAFQGEMKYAGPENIAVREKQGVSSADAGTLA